MILAIDVGNTNIVMALMNKDKLLNAYRYSTDKEEGYEYHKNNLSAFIGDWCIDGIIISSVVPEVNAYLKDICFCLTGVMPLFVNSDMNTGLDIKYDNPHKLGADLIGVSVGAVKKYGAPAIIIDIGTATTFSIINQRCEYLGGMIAPGPCTSIKSLSDKASQLPEIGFELTDKVIGTNTVDCIKIGTITAHAAMLDGMIDKVKASLGISDMRIIATGGLAKDIISLCNHKIIYDNNLIFSGLYELYVRNSTSNTVNLI